MGETFNFIVTNNEIVVKFSCANHEKRMKELVQNLRLEKNGGTDEVRRCRFVSSQIETRFQFEDEYVDSNSTWHDAVFFEQTEYPLIIRSRGNDRLKNVELEIAGRKREDTDKKDSIQSDHGELYGSLNFRNQVGNTDFRIQYTRSDGVVGELSFSTEVLSYKLDYRNDLKIILADVENEYAMLSYSFLRDTYLNVRTHAGQSTELIWWQIFKTNYQKIISSAKTIIDRPKRRHRMVTRYERAERLHLMPQELETEYLLNKDKPAYLYRTEEMVLSNDTVENRFLKFALKTMLQKYERIKSHIRLFLEEKKVDNKSWDIDGVEKELVRLEHHPFFRGVGAFKGFAQESLVMTQVASYRDIFKCWIELQQGFSLEEGLHRLEVKDISELYEMWCFIKVKNIVSEVLLDIYPDARPKTDGREVTRDFIPSLIRGGSISFLRGNDIELASVSYNASIEEESNNEAKSVIAGTETFTTKQRPDIVLRLTKENDDIKYTYLFDAKYRINDTKQGGQDVPPEDAINQIHRYRDAIYYAEHVEAPIKKEVVAGYVLFPGHVTQESLEDGTYYYEQSNKKIGIGAFPLRPDQETRNGNGELVIQPSSTEKALRKQIRAWITEQYPRTKLLHSSIPQKGLEYTDEPIIEGTYLIASIDTEVNDDIEALIAGRGSIFVSGSNLLLSGINLSRVRYLAIVREQTIAGFYCIAGTKVVDKLQDLSTKESMNRDKPYRLEITLGEYKSVTPFTYDRPMDVTLGDAITRSEFWTYVRSGIVKT